MKNSTVTLAAVLDEVTAYSDAARKAENKGSILADHMVSLGIPPGAFYAPKKDAPEVSWTLTDSTTINHGELYNKLKLAVIAAMPAKDRKLIELPKKAVPAHLAKQRHAAQCAISARMGDLRKAVERRLPKEEKPEKAETEKPEKAETEKPEKAETAAKIRIGERLIAAMKIAQGDEAPDYKHRELIQALTDALAMLGMEMPEE